MVLPRHIGFTLLAVALVFSSTVTPLHAIGAPKKNPPLQGKVSNRQKVPAGMVTSADAIKAIKTHLNAVEQRFNELNNLYDYTPSIATTTQAFQRHNASPWSTQMYAKEWGQNSLYLTWDVAKVFYTYHRDQLKESIRAIEKKAFVSQGDLQYLENGMRAWQSVESKLSQTFAQHTDLMGENAYLLGEAHNVSLEKEALNKTLSAVPSSQYLQAKKQYEPLYKDIETRYSQWKEQSKANGQKRSTLDQWLRETGYKTRLFSAINASDRLAPTTEEETQQIQPPI